MATIKSATRVQQKVLTYPAGFSPAAHALAGCKGCLGTGGDCTAAVASQQLVVQFVLDDGRAGSVLAPIGATQAQIVTAIQTWEAANPIGGGDPLAGVVV